MKVSDMLHIAHSVNDKIHTTPPTANIQSVSKTIKSKNIGALPVISVGKLVGIISERDIVTKVVAEGLNPLHTLVVDIMTTNPKFAKLDDDLQQCLDQMEQGKFRHLPVIDNGKLVGMISIRDVTVALLRESNSLNDHYQRFFIANR